MQSKSIPSIPGVGFLSRFLIGSPQSAKERLVAPLLWGIFIFVLSALPGSAYPQVTIPFADKIAHAGLYAPFGYWLARALTKCPHAASPKELLNAFIIGAVYGLSDELHQIFVPQRSCSLADWVTDCLALLVGITVWRILLPHLPQAAAHHLPSESQTFNEK